MSGVPGARRKHGALTQKVSSLEQHAAELSAQLKQLQLQNDSARRREAALTAICSVTRLAISTLQGLGSALDGIAAPSIYAPIFSVAKIDVCIDITLRNQPWGPLHVQPGPLRWPSDFHTPLAQQMADGGPHSVLQHCMGMLQRYPQHFGWVQRQTPETSRDMLYLIQGGAVCLPGVCLRCVLGSCFLTPRLPAIAAPCRWRCVCCASSDVVGCSHHASITAERRHARSSCLLHRVSLTAAL
jgi:hypothetical protein